MKREHKNVQHGAVNDENLIKVSFYYHHEIGNEEKVREYYSFIEMKSTICVYFMISVFANDRHRYYRVLLFE